MKYMLAFFLVFCVACGDARAEEPTFEESIPDSLLERKDKFFTLTVENDLFGAGTDQNYTSGVRLRYFDVGAEMPDFAHDIARAIPTFDLNDTSSVYYSLGHNLYTPEDTATTVPDPDDQPYAAFLYGSVGLTSVTDNHMDDVELTLGVVGPWAQGELVQESVHHLIDSRDPKGWDHQLENEPGFIMSWERRWPEAFAGDLDMLHVRAAPHAGIALGNIYTYAATGFTVQMTPKQYKWQSTPPRVRPAIPGNGFFAVPEEHFAWSLFAGLEGRAIARNIFLDGNSFQDSASVDKKYFVADASGGVSVTYGATQLSYTLNWRSEEFRGPKSDEQVFGAISLNYRF